MDTDSFFDEMEPRVLRPILTMQPDRAIQVKAQVSEPSLFNVDVLTPSFKEAFQPRADIRQTSPVKSPGFIPQLTPISAVRRTPRILQDSQRLNTEAISPCGCKSSPTSASPAITSSPSLDPEIREMIQDQNKQLQLLRKQVEQLLQYQEKLQGKVEEKTHESTQTSYFEIEGSNLSPSSGQILPKPNSSPLPNLKRTPQDRTEITLTFRDLHLETIMEQSQNSLQPSFSVNMQEYQDSISEEQSDESMADSCVNVMEHVQRLLAQTNISEGKRALGGTSDKNHPHNIPENPVRKVTMQRVQELGISFMTPALANAPRGSSIYCPRYNTNKFSHLWDARKETDQSVEMQRLAEKYLGKSKTYDTRTIDRSTRHSRSVEMSMSSQQYLERYGLQMEHGDFYSP